MLKVNFYEKWSNRCIIPCEFEFAGGDSWIVLYCESENADVEWLLE